MTVLERLFMGDNQVSDISALAGLTELTWINLRNNQVGNVDALAGLVNLRTLDLWNNRVREFSALKGLVDIEAIDLSLNGPVFNFNTITDQQRAQMREFSERLDELERALPNAGIRRQ
jgi:Leucine-rich repeat (LRR) protein